MNYNNKTKVLFSGNWSSSDVSIHVIPSTRELDEGLERDCKDAWEEMLKESLSRGSQLWDSAIYRFEDIRGKDDKINLYFSTIPFSIRLGMNKHTSQVKNLGESYASMGLFNSCLVETSDNKFVFIEKSNKFYTDKKYAWVGGIFSESENKLDDGIDLFSSVNTEILEELGISNEYVSSLVLSTGYITENWNVCLLFSAKIIITSEQLLEFFYKKNDGEARGLIFIPVNLMEQNIQIFEEKDREKFVILGKNC